MIDLNLIARWAVRGLFVGLLVAVVMLSRMNARLLAIAETSTATTADCVVSYRESANALQESVRSLLGQPPMVLAAKRKAVR